MNRKLFIPILLAFGSYGVSAQLTQTVNPVVDQIGNLYSKPTTVAVEEREESYLNEDWQLATFKLYKKVINTDEFSYPQVRLNLSTQSFEFLTKDGVKVMAGGQVKNFSIANSRGGETKFVNCREVPSNVPLTGFCTVESEGELKVVSHVSVAVMPADYNVALDVGSKRERVVRKDVLYFYKDNHLYEATRKSALEVMKDRQSEVKKYIRKSKVRWADKDDVLALVNYYNSIGG